MRKTKVHVILCTLFSVWSIFSFGQTGRTITGTVKNEKGEAIASASVIEVNSKNGTTTNEAGVFSLRVSPNAKIEISAVGYEKIQEPTTGRTTFSIILKTETESKLQDVIITAQNISRDKKSLGYAVATIKGDDMTKAGNVQNPLTALYGEAAGVGVEVSSSGPTGGVKINVRGNTSLNADASTRPLIVVDGIPIYDANSSMSSRGYDPLHSFDYGTGINDLNASDIESIEILKGAKATVLYGSLAGNGVMMITTRKGKSQKGWGVNLSLQSEWDHPIDNIQWQNEYGSGVNVFDTAYALDKNGNNVRALNNSRFSFGPKFDNSRILGYDSNYTTYHAYPHNYSDIFKNSTTSSATVAISGGNEKGNMRLSYTNKDYNGYFDNFYQKDNTISFNGMYKPSNFASFEVVGNMYNVKTHNRLPNIGGMVSSGINRDVDFNYYRPMYKDNLGQFIQGDNYRFAPVFFGINGNSYFQTLWSQLENNYTDSKTHFIGSAKVNLTFTNWLSATLNAGSDYTDWNYDNESRATQIYPTIKGGGYSVEMQNYRIQNYSAFLNFNHKYFDNRMDVLVYGGPAYYQNDVKDMYATTVGGLQFQDWYSLNASVTQSGNFGQTRSYNRTSEVLTSVLGNASIGWMGTYYLEVSARNDWTSTLAPGNNSYFYPGASFTYNFSDNIKIPKLNYGKFRISVADVGRGAPAAYWAYPSYNISTVQGTGAIAISSPSSLFQQDIKPERKRETEIGFETKWFKKTPLLVDFSVYDAMQYNQIMDLALTPSSGYADTKINAGKVRNSGYEFYTKFTPILNKNHRLDFTLNLANQFSKVIQLYPGITQYALNGSGGSYTIAAIQGQKVGQILLYDYAKDPKSGQKIVTNGLYTADNTHLINAGNVNPYLIGGFFADYTYKRLSLHVGLNYKLGGTFLSYTNYYTTGLGTNKQSLQYRDAAHGGQTYYINAANQNVQLPANASSAPADSKDGNVYHDGVVLNGVMSNGSGGYVQNNQIVSAYTYYTGTYVQDMSSWFSSDKLYKNDYLKLREVSLSYLFPASVASKVKTQMLQVSVFSRNLFYIFKTIPNIDPESTMGTNSYTEYTSLPQTLSLGIKLDASF